ncbi:regulatory signaling modulator protein AmpE [Pseudomonas entomophila]|jgi:AmpE protein|uniref:regulatory signaling modulator protein AmpE n=1 Tax=Pseudomonas entomophila TaxID=312306 RepID=UPI0015E44D6A|nr:regulatory signaling modulator protein AmpE [Pseudomonas entomophila]MBA1191823.1 regulatory signaling modulator protein AmpE [Pseudomonas entomophila]
MSFLALVLILVIETCSAWRSRLQHDGGFLRELARLECEGRRSSLGVLAILVVVPMGLLGVLLHTLEPVAYGLLALPVHVLVLLYSLGRGQAKGALGPFRDAWRRGDYQGSVYAAERDLNVRGEETASVLAQVQGYLVWRVYDGFFAVVFWYALFGPVGALGFRLLTLCQQHSRRPTVVLYAERIRHALDWVPARVLIVSFALVGHFVAVMRLLLNEVLAWRTSATTLLASAGQAANSPLEPGAGQQGLDYLDSQWALLQRSAVLWYVVLALGVVLA